MRLFVAICLSPSVRDALTDRISSLRVQGTGSFTRPENLHLTLAFIGETDRLEAAEAALRRAAAGGAFSITTGDLGCFEDLWWVGIRENAALERLALGVQCALRDAEFLIEDRPWRPHITLVRRWRGPEPQISPAAVSMRVEKVALMKSEQLNGKQIYTELYSVNL